MYQNSEGFVKGLYIANKDKTRSSKDAISLDEGGVIGDKFYGKKIERSVLIASLDSYKIAQENGIEAHHGSLGENILIDINPYGLSLGDKICIGEVELEITHNCTLCQSLSKVDGKLPEVLKDDRGIFSKVVRSGTIKKDDKVVISQKESV
ncbi:MAG: MOSC domain-containing protein [Campylobacterales bacterium]|nr:MOSC domain-containing protein [Campylobacterales bacterium]